MTPLLEQFLSEARDFLQGIGEKLLQLEDRPDDNSIMGELFRLVHTLKGNSGLFEFPEMTRVLHAAEDLMDAVRDQQVPYSAQLADQLLEAMDFVSELLDEIEQAEAISAHRMPQAQHFAEALRKLLQPASEDVPAATAPEVAPAANAVVDSVLQHQQQRCSVIPDDIRLALYQRMMAGETPLWVCYQPEEESFYKGEDPFFQVLQLPQQEWQWVSSREPWPAVEELDAYRCILSFEWISGQNEIELREHFRYVPEQLTCTPLLAEALLQVSGESELRPELAEFIGQLQPLLVQKQFAEAVAAIERALQLCAQDLRISSALRWLTAVLTHQPQRQDLIQRLLTVLAEESGSVLESVLAVTPPTPVPTPTPTALEQSAEDSAWSFHVVLEAQREILTLPDRPAWLAGRLQSVAHSLAAALQSMNLQEQLPALEQALQAALAQQSPAPLLYCVDHVLQGQEPHGAEPTATTPPAVPASAVVPAQTLAAKPVVEDDNKPLARRSEDTPYTTPRTLKVEQSKIDRLMNLIGEMVVAKNALPYLAGRAESVFGSRELSREIKAQYSVINRIAEEMQDAIMQVRMMPVSFVFQRFPRLVRDTAHRLGKEVHLVMEGENTEADKNIIESLADPLIHIVRNSLDHGIETPAERQAEGKPAEGRLSIRASQESDRVIIEIADDGRGIDPQVIRRKAYERGLIDENDLERLSDQQAIELIFAAGFSTAETVTDLSGRGVGMDVVRTALARVKGGVELSSEAGKGTRLRLSLPLSMAVTNVMIVESDQQVFGVPMDAVVETVRVPREQIRWIKQRQTTVLRGRIVPLVSLNELLALPTPQRMNADGEYAALVVRIDKEHLGILVDDFRETVDIILKPLSGVLSGLAGYAGSALLGDGSVLMVLDPKELV